MPDGGNVGSAYRNIIGTNRRDGLELARGFLLGGVIDTGSGLDAGHDQGGLHVRLGRISVCAVLDGLKVV